MTQRGGRESGQLVSTGQSEGRTVDDTAAANPAVAIHKRGGRENGVSNKDRGTQSGSSPQVPAAANPAAHHILDCQLCTGWLNSREKRIRALEAELAAVSSANAEHVLRMTQWSARSEKAEARVRELEKEIQACPNVNWHLYEGKGFEAREKEEC